jgi:Dockerin type I domain
LSDFTANAIPATWVNGSVLVSVIPGDANGDGVVNILDMTKCAREILGLDALTPGADANGDGNVNVLDMTKIARIILGLDP